MKTYKILIASIVLLTIGACKRTNKEGSSIGPNVISAPANFSVTVPLGVMPDAATGVNLKTGVGYFTAQFSDSVSWKLVIRKNKVDGPMKTLYGTSKSLSAINTTWKGETDYKLFGSNDACIAELTIVGDLDENKNQKTYSKTFKISRFGPEYKTTNGSTNVGSFLDYDTKPGGIVQYAQIAEDPNALFKVDKDYNDQVNGSYAMYVQANDLNADGFCGGFEPTRSTELVGKITSTDPNDVYLNVYVKGFGNANSTCKVVIYELDTLTSFETAKLTTIAGWGTLISSVSDAVASHANLLKFTDKWEARITASWIGWKLVSIKYSDFKKPNTEACNGNCKLEPNKIRELTLEVESYPNEASPVEFAVDYFVLSQGGPFKP